MLVSRDKDTSERYYVAQSTFAAGKDSTGNNCGLLINSVSPIVIVPFPSTLKAAHIFAVPQSGASISATLLCVRKIPGGSATMLTISSADSLSNALSDGTQSFSGLPAAGSTLLNFVTGDGLAYLIGGAGSATLGLDLFNCSFTFQVTQDKVSVLGI